MRRAFSLIELSIVVLIIGILIAGVTQSSRLIRESRLKSAQTLTQSSPVNSISGLSFWTETTLDNSITTPNHGTAPEDTDYVSSWNDINTQSITKINVTQATQANQPTYVLDGINGLPSIKFDGAASPNSDFLNTTSAAPIGAGDDTYTFFVVWRASDVTNSVIVAQGTAATDRMASLYISASSYGFAGFLNDYFSTTVATLTNYITAMKIDNSLANNVFVYTNSNTASNGASNANGPTTLDITAAEFCIGSRVSGAGVQPYNGLISEVIVFDRALKNSEIQDVNNYLSKKYRIKLN